MPFGNIYSHIICKDSKYFIYKNKNADFLVLSTLKIDIFV